MEDAGIPTSEQLMAEMAWVRQLARALVKDDALADDVAQDTWIVAARQQPDTDRPLRPWLGRVVRNLIITRRRGDARRAERAVASDSERPVPTPADLIERVELQRALADELLALAEPYRSTVLLHFVEGYSSAEIARRLGIPDATVRRRLKTALDQLREALRKRTDQPKRGWLAALVPLSKLPVASPASTALGVFAMKKVIAIVVVLVLLLLIGAGALWRHRAGKDGSSSSSSSSSSMAKAGAHASGVAGDPGSTSTIPAWLAKAGAPPRRIAGRVVFHGAPVAGAKVVLGFEVAGESGPVIITPDPVLFSVLQPIAEVTSAADGSFDFGVQPPLPFVVSASATKYASAAASVDNANPLAKSDQVVVALGDCGSRLYGTIADASGGGIAKAHIAVAGLSGTDSDATGAYSVCLSAIDAAGIPSRRVRVEADGYGTLTQTVLVAGELRHDFQLVPEAVLVGRVVTSNGQPVGGARVVAQVEPSELPRHVTSGWAYSDRDGRFRIEALAPGAFQLTASAGDLGSTSLAVVARPTTTSREMTLVLAHAPTARVSGHVINKGVPVSGVEIRAVPGDDTVSQADGSFVFEGLGYGATRFFVSPNYAEAAGQIEIASPVVDNVRIEVAAAARIRGHVTRDGKPVANAPVVYMPAPQVTFYGKSPATRTDASGAFTLLLPVGPGQLLAWDNPNKAFGNPVPIVTAAGDDKTVDIDLDRSGEVRGTVVNEAGAAVRGVNVGFDDGSGDGCESITDANGEFDCAMLSGGDYRPRVKPSPGSGRAFAPVVGDQFPLVSVPRSGVVTGIKLAIKEERLAIRGTVVDDTGAPMPDVHITAIVPGPSPMDPVSTLSDATGHFEIANLARGTYLLRAHAADGSEAELPSVAAGTSASLTLARAGAIEGTVSGFAATPEVFVMKSNGPMAGRAAVEGTRFSRIGLPPGRYTVEAMVGADTDGQSVEIKPGETTHVELRSRGVGTIEGTVSELATRKPLAGMRCDATISLDGHASPELSSVAHQAFTDAAGNFKVSAPRGRVRLFCFSPNPGPLSPAGIDVEVTNTAVAKANVFSVRASFGNAPSDPGFMLTPMLLPLTVDQVLPSGPAATAGLRPGDQLVTIDGVSLAGVLPIGATFLLLNHRPGTTATLGISRGGVAQTIKVAFGAGPPARD